MASWKLTPLFAPEDALVVRQDLGLEIRKKRRPGPVLAFAKPVRTGPGLP